jgi:N6-L-threonylcarbamoyladenine synthase
VIVLGIETSCDETGVAVVEDGRVRSNVIASQIDVHARFGGVVPELASRAHVMAVTPTIERALSDANVTQQDLDAVAVTTGPGLAGALLVGVAAAKALSAVLDVPLVSVNHIEGHIESAFLHDASLQPPLVALIVSGGHTMIALMRDFGSFEVLGETLDDAAGEAFDKIARFLGLGFPGGPAIDRLAASGNPGAIAFPRALPDKRSFDFSFSGLKTAVIRWVREQDGAQIAMADLAASVQEAIVDVQVAKTLRAARRSGIETVIAAGGVAANSRLRAKLAEAGARAGIKVVVPPPVLCTDNGAMIAAAGARSLARGERAPLDVPIDPGARLTAARP